MTFKKLGKCFLFSLALTSLFSACKFVTSKPESLWSGKEPTPEVQAIKAKDAVLRAEAIAKTKQSCKQARVLEELAAAQGLVTEDQGLGTVTNMINGSKDLNEYLEGSLFLNVFDNDVTLASFSSEDMARALIGTSFVSLDATGFAQSMLKFTGAGSFQWDELKTNKRTIGSWDVVKDNKGIQLISLLVVNSGQDYKSGKLGNIDVKLALKQEITGLGFTGNYLLAADPASLSFVNFPKLCQK